MNKYVLIYTLLKQVYANLLRPLLVKAIDDPEEEWDEIVLKMVDGLFGYKG